MFVAVWLFWISLALMVYVFVGYPLIIWFFAKLNKRNVTKELEELPLVDVIIVLRNAESYVQQKINSIRSLDYPKNKLNIIFVSDQSEDGTVEIIQENPDIVLIENDFKSSKSACLNQAIAQSQAEVLLLTDIRQPLESSSLKKLVRNFADPSVGAVSGELILQDPSGSDFGSGMDAYWKYEKFIRHHESLVESVPGVTGAIYAIRRECYEDIPAETLLDDVLIPMNVVLKGKKVLFEPEAIAFDIPSTDQAREKIRKTRTLAGNWQLMQLKPSLLNPFKNRIWLQFISHKILRLFSPLFLLLMLVTSIYVAQFSYFFLLIAAIQVFGYTLVLMGSRWNLLLKFKPIKIAYSFMILMYFTYLGFVFFITKKHLKIWK